MKVQIYWNHTDKQQNLIFDKVDADAIWHFVVRIKCKYGSQYATGVNEGHFLWEDSLSWKQALKCFLNLFLQ